MVEEKVEMYLDFLDPSKIEFSVDVFMKLIFHYKKTNETYQGVEVKLMFPLSNNNGYLIIYHEGNEIGLIKDYRELKDCSREVIEDVLEKRYFVPEILQVSKVEEKYRLVYWEVETDRGRMNFYTRTRNDVVVKDNRVYIRDIDSNRYLIKDHKMLSPQSQKQLSSEI